MSLLHQGMEWIHCLSSAHQHPVAVIRMGCLTSASAKASGWFLPDPFVAWISLSSWGSITHSNGSRQTSGHSSYSSAWSYHKPAGGGESRRRGGEGIREKDTLELRLTDRNHWPSYTGVTRINVVFLPLCWYGLFLNLAIVSQNTEYCSVMVGPTDRNPQWMGLIKGEQ